MGVIRDHFRRQETSLDSSFDRLVSIHVKYNSNIYTVLIDLLENVPPTLQYIQFDSLRFDRHDDTELSISVGTSRVKELDLVAFWNDYADAGGFRPIFELCPYLEKLRCMAMLLTGMMMVIQHLTLISVDLKDYKQ